MIIYFVFLGNFKIHNRIRGFFFSITNSPISLADEKNLRRNSIIFHMVFFCLALILKPASPLSLFLASAHEHHHMDRSGSSRLSDLKIACLSRCVCANVLPRVYSCELGTELRFSVRPGHALNPQPSLSSPSLHPYRSLNSGPLI